MFVALPGQIPKQVRNDELETSIVFPVHLVRDGTERSTWRIKYIKFYRSGARECCLELSAREEWMNLTKPGLSLAPVVLEALPLRSYVAYQ